MLAYALDKPIDGNKLLQDIQNLIQKQNGSGIQMILVIKLQEIVSDSTSHIPKLEYKPNQVLE